jgi:DNA-binding XRE family transcriptional regulator
MQKNATTDDKKEGKQKNVAYLRTRRADSGAVVNTPVPSMSLNLPSTCAIIQCSGMLLGGRALRIPLLGEQHEDQYNRFIRDRVREAREERAMTQETLGEFTYKSRVASSDLERGSTEITTAGLLHIAVVLEKPITFFSSRRLQAALVSGNGCRIINLLGKCRSPQIPFCLTGSGTKHFSICDLT